MMMRDAIVAGSLEIPWHTGTIHRYVNHDDEGCYTSRKAKGYHGIQGLYTGMLGVMRRDAILVGS